MKKFILGLALAFMLTGSVALASDKITSCGEDHAIYDSTARYIESCLPAEEWARVQNAPLFPDLENLVSISSGQTIMTTIGIKDTCPAWYPFGCQITKALFSYFIN